MFLCPFTRDPAGDVAVPLFNMLAWSDVFLPLFAEMWLLGAIPIGVCWFKPTMKIRRPQQEELPKLCPAVKTYHLCDFMASHGPFIAFSRPHWGLSF